MILVEYVKILLPCNKLELGDDLFEGCFNLHRDDITVLLKR